MSISMKRGCAFVTPSIEGAYSDILLPRDGARSESLVLRTLATSKYCYKQLY